ARRPVFVADAYARRVLTRHRLLGRRAGYDEARLFLEARLPSDPALFNEYHALLVRVGKTHCRTVTRCERCPLRFHLAGAQLVPAGAGQRDVERRQAELAALVHGPGARAGDDERRGGIDPGELCAHVRHDRVAGPERFRERRAPGLEPLAIAGRRVVAALVDDLRTLEQRQEGGADRPVDSLGTLGAARDVDERQHGVQAEAPDRVVGRAAG